MPTTCRIARSAPGLACLLACASAAGAPADDAVARGRDLLVQYRCGSCHTIPGVPGSRGQVVQPLTAWRHRSYIAGRLPNRPEVLQRWIVAPQSLVPGTRMPQMGVTPAEAEAMAAYLFSLE
ncbi:MAG TPA: cytochrome c [Ramlibacter sp.]|uniref:c-type cytochrome n=1 Tax=Ramlibacter sp. TaxID=1917967 RepID=UPI002D80AB17|nr:cytochrome c [Ramlibacter sp.]HET8746305.1 cytochrome c [Ramlibacter sp.]